MGIQGGRRCKSFHGLTDVDSSVRAEPARNARPPRPYNPDLSRRPDRQLGKAVHLYARRPVRPVVWHRPDHRSWQHPARGVDRSLPRRRQDWVLYGESTLDIADARPYFPLDHKPFNCPTLLPFLYILRAAYPSPLASIPCQTPLSSFGADTRHPPNTDTNRIIQTDHWCRNQIEIRVWFGSICAGSSATIGIRTAMTTTAKLPFMESRTMMTFRGDGVERKSS